MIENPSGELFDGKHELVGTAKLGLDLFWGTTEVYHNQKITLSCKQSAGCSIAIHSYNFPYCGSHYEIGVSCAFDKMFPWSLCNPALFVYTTLPHRTDTLRMLYNGIVDAVPTFNPTFPSFLIDGANLTISTTEHSESLPLIFIFREVGDNQSCAEEVGSPLGHLQCSIKDLLVTTKKDADILAALHSQDEGNASCCWSGCCSATTEGNQPPNITRSSNSLISFETNSIGVTTLGSTPTRHTMTITSVLRNQLKSPFKKPPPDELSKAANTQRKIIIQMLDISKKLCSSSQCPHTNDHEKKGKRICLNLEGYALQDQDLQEIMT